MSDLVDVMLSDQKSDTKANTAYSYLSVTSELVKPIKESNGGFQSWEVVGVMRRYWSEGTKFHFCNMSKFQGSNGCLWAFQVALGVKNQPVNAKDLRDMGSIPGLGRFSGEGNGNPLQYSCLKNPMDRRVWWATVHGLQRVEHN